MQDNYVGDIGDYGKYGLLRTVCSEGVCLAVNWYKVEPKKVSKQDDGKYTNYLKNPEKYRKYDPALFDSLYKILFVDGDRSIQRIEKEQLFFAKCFSDEVTGDRLSWHKKALQKTSGAEIVFLDPDNGLETFNMFCYSFAVCFYE